MIKVILIIAGIFVLIISALFTGLALHNANIAAGTKGKAQYVAMGSSFAAGPGVGQRAPGSPLVCLRSIDNYPHFLARKRHLNLVDRTCSGATTLHVLHGGQMYQEAQISSISQDTELVTVTVGGNDVSYLGNMIALGCHGKPPFLARLLGACHLQSDVQVEKQFESLPNHLENIAAEVHQRSPMARLVFVNYFAVLPESGTCERLGLGIESADRMRVVAKRLAEVTRNAALSNHAELFDLAKLSVAHDVCASDSWLVGMHPDGILAAPLHPNLEGMKAAADALDQFLDEPRPAA